MDRDEAELEGGFSIHVGDAFAPVEKLLDHQWGLASETL